MANMDIFQILKHDKEKQAKIDDIASKITDNIYIGNKNTSVMKKYLNEIGITHIIRVGEGLKDHYLKEFEYFSIDIWDNIKANLYSYFQPVIYWIDQCVEKNGKVLVHCYMGKSRSVTLVCCYLIKKNKIDYNKALELVQKHREIADPNDGFMKQLKEFYLKEVAGIIKVPKRYKNRSYSSYNYLDKFSSVKKFKYSTPKDEKPKERTLKF